MDVETARPWMLVDEHEIVIQCPMTEKYNDCALSDGGCVSLMTGTAGRGIEDGKAYGKHCVFLLLAIVCSLHLTNHYPHIKHSVAKPNIASTLQRPAFPLSVPKSILLLRTYKHIANFSPLAEPISHQWFPLTLTSTTLGTISSFASPLPRPLSPFAPPFTIPLFSF